MSQFPHEQNHDSEPLSEETLCRDESATEADDGFETIEEELSRRVDEHFFLRLKAHSAPDWQTFFGEFFPIAYEAARQKLSSAFQQHCEDVAIETLAAVAEKLPGLSEFKEVRPLLLSIARNKANDVLRLHYSQKRGGYLTLSLEDETTKNSTFAQQATEDFLDALNLSDLRCVLGHLCQKLRKEYRIVLHDHFFEHLSHAEIAEKHGIALGSVAKFLQRGLLVIREALERTPSLLSELRDTLEDRDLVNALLPVARAGQMRREGPRKFTISLCPPDDSQFKPSDADLLARAQEDLPPQNLLTDHLRTVLTQRFSSILSN